MPNISMRLPARRSPTGYLGWLLLLVALLQAAGPAVTATTDDPATREHPTERAVQSVVAILGTEWLSRADLAMPRGLSVPETGTSQSHADSLHINQDVSFSLTDAFVVQLAPGSPGRLMSDLRGWSRPGDAPPEPPPNTL
jgi:hypothetical protein